MSVSVISSPGSAPEVPWYVKLERFGLQHLVQVFRTQVCVALEHLLPVPMTRDKGDLLDRQPGLEEPAGRFVAKVVEVKVRDVERTAGSTKGGSDGFSVVGEDAVGAVRFAAPR